MSLSSEKRTEILQLLADGKITADEAAELLSPASETPAPPPAPKTPEAIKQPEAVQTPTPSNSNKPKWLHVHVNDLESGKNKVKVNIPLRMVKFGLSIGRRFTPELDGIDWDDLSQAMSGEESVLVDVQDAEDGEHVRIFVD